MKKSQTLLKSGTDEKYNKLNDGDLVFAFQANREVVKTEGEVESYRLDTNMDWSFDDPATPEEIYNFMGSILSSIEDVFGEKMVTKAIQHYAEERNHLVITPQGATLNFRSVGLNYKDWKKKK